ncbi:MAG TPA: tetratricopeptide repeat protein [Candidatus Eisenbacteria bacterium]|jgi:Flp pilus assembly protein TadD
MSRDAVWNLVGIASMVLLLAVAFMRRRGTSSEGTSARRSLHEFRLLMVITGVLATAATIIVIAVGRRTTDRPFDLSPDRSRLDSLKVQATAESLRDVLQAVERSRRDSANAILLDGINLAGRGPIMAAIERYDEAFKIDSTFAAPLEYKGYALFRLNRVDEALEVMRTGLRMDGSNPWAHYNYALALWTSGDTTAAVQEVGTALRQKCDLGVTIREDPQFRPFRKSVRFQALLAASCP